MIPETPGLVLLLPALLALMVLLLIKETPGIVPVVLLALLLRDREIPGTVLAALLALLPRQAPETLGIAPVAPRDLLRLRVLGIPGIALVALMVALLLLGPPGLGTVLVLLVLLPLRDLLSTVGGKRSMASVC
ncbi:hypothetical protein AtubIFM56815_009932 [Aspergillus tubingensis]|uniref:Uncharacterized protein n=1 Tax=Aspergillus tubingensis TaxID=5068 RepID=A0A9W6ELR7_ASPTU|nr:hypothetical protein AtubIFM56815_009932 [Aspergillus tubingensis]GLA91166.1 hypothetical protein AtubIFM57143_003186 [Aspergillus tubingensis]GLB15670.1 hypothetical protein AtubIFM61612_005496 [Aspergillus tubingensis]